MDSDILVYLTGEEVHAGDRVQYRGTYATVILVSNGDTEDILPGYEDYSGSERGIIICDDDGVVSTIGEPSEDLSFIDRG